MYARRVVDIEWRGESKTKALGKDSFAYFSMKKSRAPIKGETNLKKKLDVSEIKKLTYFT